MSSNLYLFDPKQAQANSGDKPLLQVMREAELARAEESARILKSVVTRVSGLFGGKNPAPVANSNVKAAAEPANASGEQDRLAA